MCGNPDEVNLAIQLNIPNFTYSRFDKLIRGEEHDFTEDEVQRLIERYKRNKYKIDIIRVKHQEVDLYDFFEDLELKEALNKIKIDTVFGAIRHKDLKKLTKLTADECQAVIKYYVNKYEKYHGGKED